MCGRPHRLFGLVVPGGRVVAVVAARQLRSPAFRRRTPVRRDRARMAAFGVSMFAFLAGFVFAGAIELALTAPASAQSFTYNPRPPKPPPKPHNSDGKMT